MVLRRHSAPKDPVEAPQYRVPGWVRAGHGEPIFLAGAALGAVNEIMRDPPAWSGVWSQRLVLRATAAACRQLGRPEDEGGLRDLWQMRRSGEGLGPSGAILSAYQQLLARQPLRYEVMVAVSQAFGMRAGSVEPGQVAAIFEAIGRAGPLEAAGGAAGIMSGGQTDRPAELFALWGADVALASTLGWRFALPLFSIGRLGLGGGPRRPLSGEPRFGAASVGQSIASVAGLTSVAVDAVDLANDIGRRASRLSAAVAKVRTREADTVVEALLREDAVTAAQVRGRISDRAARRLFERLVALGGVRELSGRPSFRIYGL